MSEFLRDLLKKAKENADGLDAPPEEDPNQIQEPESEETGTFSTKPDLKTKPGSRTDGCPYRGLLRRLSRENHGRPVRGLRQVSGSLSFRRRHQQWAK